MIDIREHGGIFGGGKTKELFYKKKEKFITIPTKLKKEHIRSGKYLKTRNKIIKFEGKFYTFLSNDSADNDIFCVLDENLNIVQEAFTTTGYDGGYAFGISRKYRKLIQIIKDGGGTWYLHIRPIDSNGNVGTHIAIRIDYMSSAGGNLVIDDENDKLYFVYAATIYCYNISTLNTSSTPLWTYTTGNYWTGFDIYGDTVFTFNNQSAVTYKLENNTLTRLGGTSASSTFTSLWNNVYDGTYIYTENAGKICKYTKELSLVSMSGDIKGSSKILSEISRRTFQFAAKKLIDGNLHVLSDYSILIIDPNNFSILDEYMLFDGGQTLMTVASEAYHRPVSPMYYNIEEGEAVFSMVTTNYYASSFEKKGWLVKSILKY